MNQSKRKELSRVLVMLKELTESKEIDLPKDLEINEEVEQLIKHIFCLLLNESKKRILAEARWQKSTQIVCSNIELCNN